MYRLKGEAFDIRNGGYVLLRMGRIRRLHSVANPDTDSVRPPDGRQPAGRLFIVRLFTARFAPTFRSAPSFMASPPCSTVRRKCLPPSLRLFPSLASLYAGHRCRFDFVDGIFFYAFSAPPRGCLPRGDPQGTLCRRDLITNSLRLKGSSQDTLVSLCLAMSLSDCKALVSLASV